MVSYEKALELVLSNLPERTSELIDLRNALGYVLAGPLVADANVPPFNRAAMDGYALRARDVEKAPLELEYAGEVRAGGDVAIPLAAGQAIAIMTGAPVPEGADSVLMVELTRRSPDGRRITVEKPVKTGENITPLGFEASIGDVVLEADRYIGPAEMAVLATFGFARVRVWSRPRVALLVTGDELVEVEANPRPDQIRNSNAYSVTAQLRLMSLEPEYLGIVRDDPGELRARVEEGLDRDVLIITGGVSMGEYDFAKQVFAELGLEMLFTRVAMKPGKPTVFARRGNKLVFGLPGNPVSAFVAFENFVRPALGRLCGLKCPDLTRIRGDLSRDMKQAAGRTAFLPALASLGPKGWTIAPLGWKGSGDIIGFARANATVIFPADRDFMAQGDSVEAMLLPDFLSRRG